jgi:hypothetical protein
VRLTFAQLSPFVADWRRLRLTDEDLRALELHIMDNPVAGDVIPGGGGVRKLRFAPPSWRRGKSGAARVIYAAYLRHDTVFLFLIYGKGERANLSAAQKKQCASLAKEIRELLEARHDQAR